MTLTRPGAGWASWTDSTVTMSQVMPRIAGGLGQPLGVADDDGVAPAQGGGVEQCGHDHLGADAGAVAHGDGDDGKCCGAGGRRHGGALRVVGGWKAGGAWVEMWWVGGNVGWWVGEDR